MSNISFDLSEKNIDLDTIKVLYEIKKVADSLNIAFFIVGATSRDFILQYCYDVTSPRMTLDIDLGVEVAGWDQFHKLSEALLSTGKFTETREKQRLLYNHRAIDIVPFGPISDKDKKISWPPEHEIFMSMLGFKEAYENSITVRLSKNPELTVKLPTLAGLALMKLISWKDRDEGRGKDAKDLLFIMNNYERAGNENRLYEEEQALLEEEGFEIHKAGIRLLGRDIAGIADTDTITTVKEILVQETGEQSSYRLVADMIRGYLEYAGKFEEALLMVEKLKKGISEVLAR